MIRLWTNAKPELIDKTIKPALGGVDAKTHKVREKLPPTKPGDLVLACGKRAISVLEQRSVLRKNQRISSLRGRFYIVGHAMYMVTFDPTLSLLEADKAQEILWDATLLKRYYDTSSLEPSIGKYQYVPGFTETINRIEERYEQAQRPIPIAVDLETLGLDPYHPARWIVSISVTYKAGQADVIRFEGRKDPKHPAFPVYSQGTRRTWRLGNTELLQEIDWLLNSPKVVVRGANFKFDLAWIYEKWGLTSSRYTTDTTLIGSLLDENRSNSLNLHAKVFTPMGGYDDRFNRRYNKARMDQVPPKDLLPYAGGDTDACWQVSAKLVEQLKEDFELSRFYTRLLQPANRAFEKMERTGVLIDREYYAQLSEELQQKMKVLTDKAIAMIPTGIREKYKDNLSLTRAVILRDYLFTKDGLDLEPKMLTTKTQAPTVSKEHLAMFEGENEEVSVFLDILKQFNAAKKTQSTFIEGFLKHVRADDRFHPTAILHRGYYEGGGDDSGTVCISLATPVLTDSGYILAQNVRPGMKVLTHEKRWKPVNRIIDNGRKPVLLTRLSSGHSILTTDNHPFWTRRGWVRARHLEEGEKVYVYGPGEIWAKVKGHPYYEVSNWGRVRHRYSGDDLKINPKTAKTSLKYLRVDLYTDGARKTKNIHSLVAAAFVSNPEGLPEIRHLDGRHWNNVAWNLAWGRAKDNGRDAVRHGNVRKAARERSPMTWDKVAYIRNTPAVRGSDVELAKELGISRKAVNAIRLEKRWREYDHDPFIYDFSVADVVSVTSVGKMATIGIEVEQDHSHVTAGIVTHNTGRTAFKDPAIQTVPKHTTWAKELRRGYIAPPGYLLVTWDYSQGELRVTACIARESNMIAAYREGIDLHMKTGGETRGLTLDQMIELKTSNPKLYALIRQGGKAGNFGLIYGMGANGFVNYARNQFGVNMSLEQAEIFRDQFFETYPMLTQWHEKSKRMARLKKQIRSPLGRIRHLPMIDSLNSELRSKSERQAINSPVQSTLSDMSQYALALFDQEYGTGDTWPPGCQFCLMTHDSLSAYVREDEVGEWVPKVQQIMESLPLREQFGWQHSLQFPVDAEGGPNLADAQKV